MNPLSCACAWRLVWPAGSLPRVANQMHVLNEEKLCNLPYGGDAFVQTSAPPPGGLCLVPHGAAQTSAAAPHGPRQLPRRARAPSVALHVRRGTTAQRAPPQEAARCRIRRTASRA